MKTFTSGRKVRVFVRVIGRRDDKIAKSVFGFGSSPCSENQFNFEVPHMGRIRYKADMNRFSNLMLANSSERNY